MKPPPFDYESPAELARAIELLAGDGDVRVLAGGQSLVPLLSLRFAYPDMLVDLKRVPGLREIRESDGSVVVGAMVTQGEAELDPILRERCPLAVEALRHIAHPQIRSRGTIGGSIAHADPAAELPAALLALGGRVQVAGPRGKRTIDASVLFAGLLTTTLDQDEILTAVEFPVARPQSGTACVEFTRRPGDYALAGCVAQVQLADGAVADLDLGFFGVSDRPVRSEAIETAALGAAVDEAPAKAAAAATEQLELSSDPDLPEDYRRHLVGVVARRATQTAIEEAL